MAKKTKSADYDYGVDWVRCELTVQTREQLFKFDVKGEATFDTISKLVDDGYKLSVSSDKIHNCVGAYLTSPTNPTNGRKQCLSGRGPDVFGALRAVIFKHSVVLAGDWGDIETNDSPASRWG